MTTTLHGHIGTVADMGERFKAAWKDAETGLPDTGDHVASTSRKVCKTKQSPAGSRPI